MKRCSIILHSVNGNCYIMGSHLQEQLKQCQVDARLYRVEDEDLHIWANKQETTNDFYEDILALPVASIATLEKSSMIILGSPTRFGNVSSEMKTFLDSTYDLMESRNLADKFFGCFTSCTHSMCDGSRALETMIWWAQNMGMLHIPFGLHADLPEYNQPSNGIIHLEGKDHATRPSQSMGKVITAYAETLAAYVQE